VYGYLPLICSNFLFYVNYTIDSLNYIRAYGSGKEDTPACDVPGFENTRMKLLRHVSFVDCPV
jgi:translation initiation factor 2 gamma subunit (eIF-2gamma)